MTGHEGLIGSFLLKRLKQRGDRQILLIDKRSGNSMNELDKFEIKEKIDLFIHFGAFCKINKTIENPDLAFENNVLATYKVLEFCRKNKIPKIIFTSSSRVLEPEKNPYTASKIYGEELVKAYSQCYNIEYVIIRPSTVYGPFNDLTSRLVDIFILNALKGGEIKIYGDENKTLDFTYVDDFVDGILLAMNTTNEEFDLSAGEMVNISKLADMIITLAGNGVKKFYPPEIAQPQEVELDITKIKKLGYVPKVFIEEGIKKTFKWYKENFKEILKTRK